MTRDIRQIHFTLHVSDESSNEEVDAINEMLEEYELEQHVHLHIYKEIALALRLDPLSESFTEIFVVGDTTVLSSDLTKLIDNDALTLAGKIK